MEKKMVDRGQLHIPVFHKSGKITSSVAVGKGVERHRSTIVHI
jgi:hypothetical protein